MYPGILLFGKAGSGKDTVASYLVQHHRATAIAMADPMKRFAAKVFGFSEEQLWGPSTTRNALDRRFHDSDWTDIEAAFRLHADPWIQELGLASPALDKLYFWKQAMVESSFQKQGLSARTVLQTLGTEFGRAVDTRLWIRYAQSICEKLLEGGVRYDRTQGLVSSPGTHFSFAVVTDGRFPNECLDFKRNGFTTVRIRDPEGEALSAAAQQGGVQGHSSETAQDTIPDYWFDAVILNNKSCGLQYLYSHIESLLNSLKCQTWG